MSKTETCCGSHFPGRALVAAEQIDTYTHAKPGTSLHGGGRGQASLLWLQDARSCPLFQLRLESNLELGHKSLQPRSSHLPWITPKKSSNCLSSLHRRNDRPPPIYFRPRHQKNHDGIATCHGQPWKLAESCAMREVSNSHSSTEASFRFKHCFCSQPKGHLKLLCQLLCTAAKSKCCLPCSDRNAGRGLQLLSTHRLKERLFPSLLLQLPQTTASSICCLLWAVPQRAQVSRLEPQLKPDFDSRVLESRFGVWHSNVLHIWVRGCPRPHRHTPSPSTCRDQELCQHNALYAYIS